MPAHINPYILCHTPTLGSMQTYKVRTNLITLYIAAERVYGLCGKPSAMVESQMCIYWMDGYMHNLCMHVMCQ